MENHTIQPWLEGIEGDRLPRLIQSDNPMIRVVAGPGAGKSEGLKRRVRRLVERDAADPDGIFVGTFTRAIAADLQETLGEHNLRVSTLHSLALSLLREHQHVLGGRTLRFLLAHESDVMLYDVREDTGQGDTIHGLRRELG